MIHVTAAPGHTPGSVCYRTAGETLFVGDAAWLCRGPRTLPRIFNQDQRGAEESLVRLTTLPGVRQVVTAHSGALGFDALCGSLAGSEVRA